MNLKGIAEHGVASVNGARACIPGLAEPQSIHCCTPGFIHGLGRNGKHFGQGPLLQSGKGSEAFFKQGQLVTVFTDADFILKPAF